MIYPISWVAPGMLFYPTNIFTPTHIRISCMFNQYLINKRKKFQWKAYMDLDDDKIMGGQDLCSYFFPALRDCAAEFET